MQSFTITIPLTITFAMGTPQTHCVKLEIPPIAVPGRHVVKVPKQRSAKLPCVVMINDQPVTVAACVANVLAEYEGGATEFAMRRETHGLFVAQVPAIRLVRADRKVVGNRVWWRVG